MATVTIPPAECKLSPAFADELKVVLAAQQAKVPALIGVLGRANALLEEGRFTLGPHGTEALVQSVSPEGTPITYGVSATSCECPDQIFHPKARCKHLYAWDLYHLVQKHLARQGTATAAPATAPAAPLDDDWPPEEMLGAAATLSEVPFGIDPRHMQMIQGKPFVKFAGLLELAHKRGLQSLSVDWTFNDAEWSLAHAVAVFPFGTFAESGDASPTNVTSKVRPHFRRVALTRAAARALRLALGLDMVACEELAEEAA